MILIISREVVRLGELDTKTDDEGATAIDVGIKSKVTHEKFKPSRNGTKSENDIGVLILWQNVEFTSEITFLH